MKKIALFISGLAFCLQTSFAQKLVFSEFDLLPGAGKSSAPSGLTTHNGLLYFSAYLQSDGFEPWSTDGTIINTYMVKNVAAGSIGSNPKYFTPINTRLVFVADDGNNTGAEPWITDGTSPGTQLIKDIIPGGLSSTPEQLCNCNGTIFFVANTFAEGPELWVTDGTTAGTRLLKDINKGAPPSSINSMRCWNNKIIFNADSGTGSKLWVSDGTDTGTKWISNNRALMYSEYNGNLYMAASGMGIYFYITDGTKAGTTFKSTPAEAIVVSKFSIVYKNMLYFNGFTTATGPELYKTDMTSGGTTMVKEFTPGAAGALIHAGAVLDDKLLLVVETSAEGKELWITDGTTAGTQIVKDIIPGLTGSNPTNLLVYKHHVYFTADSTPGDRQLYVTDGTAAGTHTVRPSGGVKNALDATIFNGFTEYNGSIYYSAYHDSTTCNELWWFTDTATYTNNVPNTASNTHTFSIYPNPNNGTCTLETNNDFKNGMVSVYDMMGRLIKSEKLISKSETISVNAPKGIYMVKLQLDDAVLTKRVTIE